MKTFWETQGEASKLSQGGSRMPSTICSCSFSDTELCRDGKMPGGAFSF